MIRFLKRYSILLLVLVMAMTLILTACESKTEVENGEQSFLFTVEFPDGTSKEYTVKTDRSIVGDALVDEGLIAGEAGQYGLYVKTVDGVTLDYESDGKYWSFYVDGQYAMSGVDTTKIEEGKVYSFKAESAS